MRKNSWSVKTRDGESRSALVVNRDGDSWFCLEQSMAPEICEGIIHIWLKIIAESDGSDCSYQKQ